MGVFSNFTRKPRKYHRVSIYTDESKDKLQKLVDDTLREEGKKPSSNKPYDPTKFNGTFNEYTPRAKKFREEGSRFGWPLAIALIVILLVIWRFLMTGIR